MARIILSLILMAAVAGCAQRPSEGIPIVRNVQHVDIPAPPGAEFDPASWDYQEHPSGACALRSSQVIYWKDSPIQHLTNWYMQVMPSHGWKHVRTDDGEKTSVVFHKGIEEAVVNLDQAIARDREGYITRITIDIGVQ